MTRNRFLILIPLLGLSLLWAEPSVYGGGYGGGSQSAQNKKMIFSLRQQVNRLQEEVEGLKSIVQSLSQQIGRLTQQKSGGEDAALSRRLESMEARIAKLEKRPAAPAKRTTPSKSSKSSATAASKSGSRSSASATASKLDDRLKKAASSKLFSRGVRLVNQKRYSDAKRRFDILEARKYKPAATNFYLGEIAYRTGRYDDAIRYYQKSAELNENAAYMDRLLLHTGIALEKSGDKAQARSFFQAIVDGYPGTVSAKIAKKHLK